MSPENDREGERRRVGHAPDDGNSRSSGFRAAVYARVSAANHGQDPTAQTRELRSCCRSRSNSVPLTSVFASGKWHWAAFSTRRILAETRRGPSE